MSREVLQVLGCREHSLCKAQEIIQKKGGLRLHHLQRRGELQPLLTGARSWRASLLSAQAGRKPADGIGKP